MVKDTFDILIDFDGTCTTHDFPRVGKDIGAAPVLRKLVENGHKLILFTMRCDDYKRPNGVVGGKFLTDAVNWFKTNEIPLYGIQSNPTQKHWTSSPKAHGNLIIDDTSLGCPLKIDLELSDKLFIDWELVEIWLTNNGLIKTK